MNYVFITSLVVITGLLIIPSVTTHFQVNAQGGSSGEEPGAATTEHTHEIEDNEGRLEITVSNELDVSVPSAHTIPDIELGHETSEPEQSGAELLDWVTSGQIDSMRRSGD